MVRKVFQKSVIHCVLRHGEAAISNKKEAEKSKREFCDIIKANVSSNDRSLMETKKVNFGKSCQIALL